jgi:two-component system, sensor histidine kinase
VTPGPADGRTRLALLRQFYDLSRLSLLVAALLAVLHVGFTWGHVPHWMPTLWAVLVAGQVLMRAAWRATVMRLADGPLAAQAPRWTRRAVVGSLLTGVLWGAALVMAFEPGRESSVMYITMLSCVILGPSISVMVPLPRAFVALLLPMVGTLMALVLSLGTLASAFYALVIAVGAVLAVVIIFRYSRVLHESHALRYEREELLAQAQRARQAQVRFLAAASHDLRQPVHALGLLAAQVHAELHGRRAAATAEQLQAMAVTLDELVEALLDVSRLDGGAVQPRVQAMPLAPLFDRLAPEFAVLADGRGLQWRLRPTTLWVHSDAELLERMLRNLVANALRYTTHGGVLLAARRRGGRVEVAVWDTGAGIAPEHQARIFDEFVQLQNPGRDRSRGHGLGLAIVARLSRLLAHPVRLSSRVGQGSCFVVDVPWARAAPATASAIAQVAVAHAAGLAQGAGSPLAGLVVALVEDDDAVRDATASLLRTWGCEVWADASAEPLVARLDAAGVLPARLISDWRLGQGDGVAAIAAVRAFAARRRLVSSQAPGLPSALVPVLLPALLPALLLSAEALPHAPVDLAALHITAARKPLPAPALRAWLSAPVAGRAAEPGR